MKGGAGNVKKGNILGRSLCQVERERERGCVGGGGGGGGGGRRKGEKGVLQEKAR